MTRRKVLLVSHETLQLRADKRLFPHHLLDRLGLVEAFCGEGTCAQATFASELGTTAP